MPNTAVSSFKRKPPHLILRCALGAWIDGVARPMIWSLQKLGRAERAMASLGARFHERLEKKNPFRGYVPGEQDVFVMTYAKSGTNWMMQIVHQLIYHGKAEYDHIHCVVPWPDTKAMSMLGSGYAIPIENATDWETSPERKRVVKTHFNWEMIPHSENARYIAVIRDPKDVFVSNYFFIRDGIYGRAMPSVDTWYNLFLSEHFLLGGSWAVNAAGYWAQRHRPNVLIVSFKSMKRDLKGTVLKVADFLNVRVSDDVIQEVCDKSSFTYMKGIDHKFSIGKMIPWRPGGAMMRKGTQGGSSELLSPKRQLEMDAHFMAELKRLGSDFPYEEFCDMASPRAEVLGGGTR